MRVLTEEIEARRRRRIFSKRINVMFGSKNLRENVREKKYKGKIEEK